MPYVAIVNVPGYLPEGDDPTVFDTISHAWAYLAYERERDEDTLDSEDEPHPPAEYSETVTDLRNAATSATPSLGTVYGSTPGYRGGHDLGLAYSVDLAEPDDSA